MNVSEKDESTRANSPGATPYQLLADEWRPTWWSMGKAIGASKVLILVAVLGGLIAALLGSFFVREVYESRATIHVGTGVSLMSLPGPAPFIEPPEITVERIKELYGYGDRSVLPHLKDVRANRSAKTIIALTASGETGRQAKDFLNTVVTRLLNEHKAELGRSLAIIDQEVGQIRVQIEEMNRQSATLSARAREMEKQGLAGAMVLTVELGGLLDQITRLKRQQFDLQTLQFSAKSSSVVSGPTDPSEPAVPNRYLYGALGAVLGLIIGVAVALVLNARDKRPNTTTNGLSSIR